MRKFLHVMCITGGGENLEERPARYASLYIGLLFLTFIDFFALNLLVPPADGTDLTARLRTLMEIYAMGIAMVLILKNHLPKGKWIVLSAILAMIVFSAQRELSSAAGVAALEVLLCSLVSFRVFEKYPRRAVKVIHGTKLRSCAGTLLCGLLAGGLLGVLSLLMSGEHTLEFRFEQAILLEALGHTILEEVCFRLILAAACIELLGGKIRTRAESIWYLVMLTAPHTLMHAPDILSLIHI